MKSRFHLAVITAALLLTATGFSQENMPLRPGAFREFRESITVTADGRYDAMPDTALVQFNIAAQEADLKAANDRANRAAEQIRQALRANGLDPKQAEIGMFQVAPVYDWKTPKRKLIAYRVSASISMKLKDFSKVGPLAASFADMDVTENQSISYLLDDIQAAKLKAVEDATRKARGLAEAVATTSQRPVGGLLRATVDTVEVPPPVPMMMRAKVAMAEAAPAPEQFSPEKITVNARVTAEYALR